jgi:hypothetical protein
MLTRSALIYRSPHYSHRPPNQRDSRPPLTIFLLHWPKMVNVFFKTTSLMMQIAVVVVILVAMTVNAAATILDPHSEFQVKGKSIANVSLMLKNPQQKPPACLACVDTNKKPCSLQGGGERHQLLNQGLGPGSLYSFFSDQNLDIVNSIFTLQVDEYKTSHLQFTIQNLKLTGDGIPNNRNDQVSKLEGPVKG